MRAGPPSRRDFFFTLGVTLAAEPSVRAEGGGLPDTSRPLTATGADVGSLFPEIEKIAGTVRPAYSFLSDRFRDHHEFRRTARAKVFETLLYNPEEVDPKPEILDRVDCGDHVREKLLFSTTPFFRVPAYVLVPKNLRDKAPGIVDLHSHGGMFLFGKEKVVDLGVNHPAMVDYHKRNYDGRPTATALVRRGYVVITVDAFAFGERRILLDADLQRGWERSNYDLDTVKLLNQQCRAKETTLVKALTLAGATWPGIVFHDDMRTVDYLASRPEVDPQRIGCLGISMGGYRALFLTALDERIRAGCVTGFMSTVGPMIKAHVDTHSWVHFLPGLHRYLDWPDVASLAAPRGLMVQQCERDRLFPLAGMRDSVAQIAAAYTKAEVKERFVGRFYDEPHHWTRAMQEEAFTWLDRELGHRPS